MNYNNNFRWVTPIVVPEILDSYSFAAYYNEAALNNNGGARFDDPTMQRILDFQNGILKDPVPVKSDGVNWEDSWSKVMPILIGMMLYGRIMHSLKSTILVSVGVRIR